eukprot:1899184-Prorocentrum_lima.AAC.1
MRVCQRGSVACCVGFQAAWVCCKVWKLQPLPRRGLRTKECLHSRYLFRGAEDVDSMACLRARGLSTPGQAR